jgi:hypothetical protein
LDVTLWKGFPPKSVSLLNITGKIAKANMGDDAIAFGFASGVPRSWQGTILGKLGYNTLGRHFGDIAFEHEDELLFNGAQDFGMSGAAVLNGRGESELVCDIFHVIYYVAGYLGICRAVIKDRINNILPVVTPWSLIASCVMKHQSRLSTIQEFYFSYPNVTVLTVPQGLQ